MARKQSKKKTDVEEEPEEVEQVEENETKPRKRSTKKNKVTEEDELSDLDLDSTDVAEDIDYANQPRPKRITQKSDIDPELYEYLKKVNILDILKYAIIYGEENHNREVRDGVSSVLKRITSDERIFTRPRRVGSKSVQNYRPGSKSAQNYRPGSKSSQKPSGRNTGDHPRFTKQSGERTDRTERPERTRRVHTAKLYDDTP